MKVYKVLASSQREISQNRVFVRHPNKGASACLAIIKPSLKKFCDMFYLLYSYHYFTKDISVHPSHSELPRDHESLNTHFFGVILSALLFRTILVYVIRLHTLYFGGTIGSVT